MKNMLVALLYNKAHIVTDFGISFLRISRLLYGMWFFWKAKSIGITIDISSHLYHKHYRVTVQGFDYRGEKDARSPSGNFQMGYWPPWKYKINNRKSVPSFLLLASAISVIDCTPHTSENLKHQCLWFAW